MGIWIRSQNKCVLCNANTIWVDGEDVFANNGVSNYAELGEYDTEAEAIRVLDMIQERISAGVSSTGPVEGWGGQRHSCNAFQMPPTGQSKECGHKNIILYHDNSVLCKDCHEVVWQAKTLSEPIPSTLRDALAGYGGGE